tara:strand:+ start:928 stop:2532 length:1605 start_codon:yes stop_codon:yes gene_type:complete
MQQAPNGQPVQYIMANGTQQTNGSAAQRGNISAAKAVASAVKTTLGPLGMDKMLIDPAGNILITNDGVTILREIGIEHPAAKMIVEVAKTQESHCHDGTTSAVVLSGALLEQAEHLLNKGIHPTTICKGFRIARDRCIKELNDWSSTLDIKGSLKGDSTASASKTSLTGKSAEGLQGQLTKICLEAVQTVDDFDDIRVISVSGKGEEDTTSVAGLVIERGLASPNMIRSFGDAKILLMDCAIEPKSTSMETQVQITSPDQVAQFLEQEENSIREMVANIVDTGCNVLFTQRKVDDLALHYLKKANISVAESIQKSDLNHLTRITGASIVSSVTSPISEEELGTADFAVNDDFDDDLICISVLNGSPVFTIIASGATRHVAEEMERAIEDAVGVAWLAEREPLLPGAGATQAHLHLVLKAVPVVGRQQMAVEAFGEALLSIPDAISENAGLDPVDVRVDLLAAHKDGDSLRCINIDGPAERYAVGNARKSSIVEPLSLHTQAITSATEAAIMILRIDDVIRMNPEAAGQGGLQPM